MARRKIPLAAARRIALASQGLDRPRPAGAPNAGHIRRLINGLGLLQLDFVNVLVPAHLMVVFSRLGPYDRGRFHETVYRSGHFTEQWAHEASIVPTGLWGELAHRREDYQPYPGSPIMKLENKSSYIEQVHEIVKEKGPVTTQDLPPLDGPERRPGDWHRSLPRWALEYLFGNGAVAVADRLPNFQRVYDLPERVLTEAPLGRTPTREASQRALLRRAAAACGVGTMQDLADYYRMSPRDAAARLPELLDEGELEEVEVEGWRQPAYLSRHARRPRKISTARLLSPFDPLVWYRPRAERLFDFHYRIEIYVPARKRRWGYYVLPFLLDDRLVARVDLKADRQAGSLQVLATHGEPDIDETRTADALAKELRLLAEWLGLDEVRVRRKGDLAASLARLIG